MDKFIDVMLDSLGRMDLTAMEPVNLFVENRAYAKEWVEKISALVETLENLPAAEVAAAYPGACGLRGQLYFLLLDLKAARTPKNERERIANFFHELLLEKNGEEHGHGANLVHNETEIHSFLDKEYQEGSPSIARLLGRLYSAGYNLASGLYGDFYPDHSVENFGPYPTGAETLVVKHFEDLQPLFSDVSTPSKQVTIFCKYRGVRFACDAVSSHTRYEGDPHGGLVAWHVESDRKALSEAEVVRLCNETEAASVSACKELRGLDRQELLRYLVRARSYVLRPLFRKARMNWEPSPTILAAAAAGASDSWRPPEENEQEYWRKVLHPREEFYG